MWNKLSAGSFTLIRYATLWKNHNLRKDFCKAEQLELIEDFAGIPGFKEFDEFGIFQEFDFFIETQAFRACVFQDRQVHFYDSVP